MNPAFMHEAIRISLEMMRANKGGPFGAVIVRDGKIVGCGWNQVTSTNDPTAHAEVTAIRDACKNLQTFQLTDCELYTSCEPCPMCLAASYWARLRKVYFGNTRQDASAIGFDDEFLYNQIGLPLNERTLILEQCCPVEAKAAFEEWKNKPDKILY
ncbi:MAG: nucleoside deaminase [Verrucomicrobia bacterium]|nr:nucleoside deaminase [Verrucomicrobiota bacterium]